MEEDKKNILYKPDLSYDKQYGTEGYQGEQEEIIEQELEDDIVQDISNNIIRLETLTKLLPNDFAQLIKSPLNVVKSVVGDLTNIGVKPETSSETVVVIKDKEDDKIETDFPSSFFRDDDDPFLIVVKSKDKVEIIKDTYSYDLASVIADYVQKLNGAINNYLNDVLVILKEVDKTQYQKVRSQYTGNTANVQKNYKHLSDLIIRSQIGRDIKMRFYNKKYNLDNSIAHIRSCKAGVEQRIRYYEASYQKGKSYTESLSDTFLAKSRLAYDRKYKQNFFNLYKYLNSSVILLNECLRADISEVQAKIILTKKEGNDLW